MDDSEFTQDFASSFLTWDDDGVPTSPAPAPEEPNAQQTASMVAIQQQQQQSVSQQYTSQQQTFTGLSYQNLMMANPLGGHQSKQHLASGAFTTMSHQQAQQQHQMGMLQQNFNAAGAANVAISTTSTGATSMPLQATPVGGAVQATENGSIKAPQLHPLGIQSSANCPPHVAGTAAAAAAGLAPNTTFLPIVYNPILQPPLGAITHPNQHQFLAMVQAQQQQQLQQQQQHAQHHHQAQHQAQHQHQAQQQQHAQHQLQAQQHAQQQQHHAQQQAQHHHHAQQQHQLQQAQQQAQQQQHQAQQHQAQHQAQQQAQQHQQLQSQHRKQQQQQQQSDPPAPSNQQQQQFAPTPAPSPCVPAMATQAAALTVTQQQHPVVVKAAKAKPATQPNGKPIPPFYLFDAPCELRANFMQSQRAHGLPVPEDSNYFHYGMAVNGFHPQLNAQMNPVLPLASGSGSAYPPGTVQLIDARSKKKNGSGRQRNEREQKRAQKITELIEELRMGMEDGGWKVEMKSKYHTLSKCADYVKFLTKNTKEKEDAVDKAKEELEMKEHKLEEDKADLESRSDPESVTSSLSAMTSSDDSHSRGQKCSRKRKGVDISAAHTGAKQQKANSSSSEDGSDSNEGQGSGSDEGGSGRHSMSLNKMSSSISDMTDSNKGSSQCGDEKRARVTSITASAAADDVMNVPKQEPRIADFMPQTQKDKEMTSLDADFDLDYEEVFVSSNVPQLIATPAGRVVTCNKFFVAATGLSQDEISRMTIFSIVKPEKLCHLFEMVAEALRDNRVRAESEEANAEDGSDAQSSSITTAENSDKITSESGTWEYAAMTLPCISFPNRSAPGSTHHPNPLYMTMALMYDEDPRRRCFHCILTDDPGTNGEKMGFLTPELLALLFSTERRIKGTSPKDKGEPSIISSETSPGVSNTRTSDSYSLDLAETVAYTD